MPLFFIVYFTNRYWYEYILPRTILRGGCIVVWTWSGLEPCFFKSCNQQRNISLLPNGDGQCGHWSTAQRGDLHGHIYFQITQPVSSSTVTSLYQYVEAAKYHNMCDDEIFSERQCCGTVTIYYDSVSDFWQVPVPVPVSVPARLNISIIKSTVFNKKNCKKSCILCLQKQHICIETC